MSLQNNAKHSDNPIGIFDSGIGGLTIARAFATLCPKEHIIYFGDTAHLPYGDKSAETIQHYTKQICDFLLEQNCKLILIACHSASAAAYPYLKDYINHRAELIDVIHPTVEYLKQHHHDQTVGLIGTKQTVFSNIYPEKIDKLNREFQTNIKLITHATGLLAPAIEEDFSKTTVIDSLLEEYLNHSQFSTIQSLILGCTHYPVIKAPIDDFFENKVELIDTAEISAKAAFETLKKKSLLAEHQKPELQFYVSDYTDAFAKRASLFFPHIEDLMLSGIQKIDIGPTL